jgi:hypothetical protein
MHARKEYASSGCDAKALQVEGEEAALVRSGVENTSMVAPCLPLTLASGNTPEYRAVGASTSSGTATGLL